MSGGPLSPRDLARLRALVARAAHPSTPRHEAESSAMIACRLMAKDGVLDALEVTAAAFNAHDYVHRGGVPPGYAPRGARHWTQDRDAWRWDAEPWEVTLLLVKETHAAYRFALCGADVRRRGAAWTSGWLQKTWVRDVSWAPEAEVRSVFRLDPKEHRVATAISLEPAARLWRDAVEAQIRRRA